MRPGIEILKFDEVKDPETLETQGLDLTTQCVRISNDGYKKLGGDFFDTRNGEPSLNNILELTPEELNDVIGDFPLRKQVYSYCVNEIKTTGIVTLSVFGLLLYVLGENEINCILIGCLDSRKIVFELEESGLINIHPSKKNVSPFSQDFDNTYYSSLESPGGGGIGARKTTRKRRHSKPRRAKSKKHKKRHATKKKRHPPMR